MINTGTAIPRLDLLGPILEEGIDLDAYVSTRVLPTIGVNKLAGAIPSFLFTDAQALRIKHTPKTPFARIVSKLGQKQYLCEEAGVEEPLSYEDYEILGKDQAQELICRKLLHIVLRSRDIALAGALFSGAGETLFANTLISPTNAWNAANGVPLDDVLAAKRAVALQTGVPPDTMLISYDLYLDLCKNPQIQTLVRNVMGYGGGEFTKGAVMKEIPESVLAMTFGLKEIIVARGVVDANGEGAAAQDLEFIWPRTYCLVFKKAQNSMDVREISLGRTFTYDLANQFNDLTTMQITDTLRAFWAEQYPDPATNTDILRVREYVDMQVLNVKAGALIEGI